MGEYIGASIQFGGKLRKELVPELVDLLNASGLTPDFDESEDVTADHDLGQNFGDWQINYGNLDDLKMFAMNNGLHYRYWVDSGPEWVAETLLYDPGTDRTIEVAGGGGGPVSITLKQIKELGTIEAIEAYFAKFTEPMPALEII